jgi:hypothetical protein
MSDEGVISKIYKEFLQLNSIRQKSQLENEQKKLLIRKSVKAQ